MPRRKNDLGATDLAKLNDKLEPTSYSFDDLLEIFIDDCIVKNLREHTIKYYRNELHAYQLTLHQQSIDPHPAKITSDIIKRNVITYYKSHGLKTVSINTRLRAIRAFFNYLHKNRYIRSNPMADISLLRDRKTVIPTLSNDQIRALLRQPNLKTFVGVRDLTALMLFIETGVRVKELVSIDLNDIRFDESMILIREAKGYLERLVPIQKKMKEQLRRYISIRGEVGTEALFITVDNTRLTKRQMQNRVTYYGRQANIKNVRCSCHTLRHSFAKISAQNGASVFELQAMLGHTSMEMVRVYVNLFGNDVREKHKNFSPLKNI